MEAMCSDLTRSISKLTSEETEKSKDNTFLFYFVCVCVCCINLFWSSKLQQGKHNRKKIWTYDISLILVKLTIRNFKDFSYIGFFANSILSDIKTLH